MFEAKLVINGKEFPIEIYDPKLIELVEAELKPKKHTGYERVAEGEKFYYSYLNARIVSGCDNDVFGNNLYETGNYYSDKTVAENNIRADRLMRKLRRFAVEHREGDIIWGHSAGRKYVISYDYHTKEFSCFNFEDRRAHGCIYFDSMKAADLAIETFRDELIWYFTEYKDSL